MSNLLKRIYRHLLDIDSSLEVVKDKFIKEKIDIDNFLEVIKFYIDNFSKLQKFHNEVYIDLLYEKLRNILNNYKYPDLNKITIEASMNFIIKNQETFFGTSKENVSKEKAKLEEFAYLDSIKIKNYFSIKDIEITGLKDKKEVYFVGGNGEGKTILLQAIVLALKKDYPGQVIEYIRDIKSNLTLEAKCGDSKEYQSDINMKSVFAYGINRNKVREKYDTYGYSGLFDTSDFKDTTFLKNPIKVINRNNQIIQDFVKKLNSYILKEELQISYDDNKKIILKENNINIEFDKLSEGYKSTLIWICDFVSRAIEGNNNIKSVSEIKAIVLVDEIDLYLHPSWKYDFVFSLRKVFPNVQFLMITHSLVTILGASEDAIFYKIYKEDGETKISKPIDNIKNLMANTLSTSPLFDMNTARARNSNNDIDTSSDFIYSKIHKSIAKRVKEKKPIIEKDISSMIEKELDEFLKKNS